MIKNLIIEDKYLNDFTRQIFVLLDKKLILLEFYKKSRYFIRISY